MKTQILLVSLFLSVVPLSAEALIRVAHRGASGYLPEHTLPAAALAHSWNVDFIEPDLVMTKDDQLIVMHDPHLDTTTNVAKVFPKRHREDGRFYAIDFTWNEIKQLDVSERFDRKTGKAVFPGRYPVGAGGFKVPKFEDFIELVQALNKSRKQNIGIIPELKKPEFHAAEGKDIVKKAIEVLSRYGYADGNNVYLQSFWPDILLSLKKQSKIPLVQLIGENSWKESSANYDKMLTDEGLKHIATYAAALSPTLEQLERNPGLIKKAQALGLKVIPYTHRADQLPKGMTNEALITRIKASGVDGVFSDFADQF